MSYAPRVVYDHLDTDTAHLVLYADSDKDHRTELASVFGEVFEGLDKVDDSEVEAARQQILEHWTGTLAPPPAEIKVGEVHRAALDWIFGKEFESIEALATEICSVTASDVSNFGRDLQTTALFALPGEADNTVDWIGNQALRSTVPAVEGRKTLSVDAPIERVWLVLSPDGVSKRGSYGSHQTVRYTELAAALYYEDGGVCLVGTDGSVVTVEPTLWRDGQMLCRKIREQVPAHLLLARGSRSADAIPKPKTTAWQRFRSRLT